MADSYNNNTWSNSDEDHEIEGGNDAEYSPEDHYVEEHKPWPSASTFELRQTRRLKDEILSAALGLERKLNHQMDISDELLDLEENLEKLVNAGIDFTDKERLFIPYLRDRFEELLENGYIA